MVSSSVLLVLPDNDTRRGLVQAVTKAGYECFGVPTGEAAVDAFVQQPFHIVFTALRLPGRDGSATIESLRWAPGGEQAHMVLMGARTDAGALEREAARLGALTHLIGDVSVGDVLRVVERIVRRELRAGSVPPPGMWSSSHDETRRYTPTEGLEGAAVDRHAIHEPSRTPSLEGRLADVPFGSVLVQINDSRSTGALALTSHGDRRPTTTGEVPKKVIFFRKGMPHSVRSNLVEECLGSVLRRRGIIDQSVVDDSLLRVRAGDGRQGAVLLAMGAITPQQLHEALEHQQEKKLLDIFGWDAGTFEFAEMEPPQETLTLKLSLFELVLRGVREHVPPPRVVKLLDPVMDRFAVPVPKRLVHFQQMDLAPELQMLLAQLDGQYTVRSALGGSPTVRPAQTSLLYAVTCVRAVELREFPLEHGVSQFPSEPAPRTTAPPEPPSAAALLDLEAALRAFREGEDALSSGAFDDAQEAFTRATELDPNEGIYWVFLGYCRHAAHRDDAQEADRALTEVVAGCRLVPGMAVAHLLRARVLKDRAEWSAARNAYERVLHIAPDDPEAIVELRALSTKTES